MLFVEQYLAFNYLTKSIFKLVIFNLPIVVTMMMNRKSFAKTIGFKNSKLPKWIYILMGAAYVGIIILFFVFQDQLNTDTIRSNLMNKEKLTKENCLLVFSYIIIVNSFLEESFFRGYTYNTFATVFKKPVAMVLSGVLFAIYHIGIVSNWFNPLILVLCISGLSAVGMALQYISLYFGAIKASWLIHACANLAINTIGTIIMFR